MKFAPRMGRFKASPSQIASARVRDMVASGHDIVKLTAGEPDFPTPDNAKFAAIACMDANEIRYTPINGLPEMRQAVQLKFKRDNNLDYDLDQIAVGSGTTGTRAGRKGRRPETTPNGGFGSRQQGESRE